jgi:glutamate synthase domain-containing protein 2/glutamate synthase domain-containing protein 1/glutamate synthase domain-containing protein 3
MDQRQISAASGRQRTSSPASHDALAGERRVAARVAELPEHPDYPLYDPQFEHDACGTGFVANQSGAREHRVVALALEALANLAHRGAMDADAETSDGAGVMTQIPYHILLDWLVQQGMPVLAEHELAVGMLFLPRGAEAANRTRAIMHEALEGRGARVLGWRLVPVDATLLGDTARRASPQIEQVLVQRPAGATAEVYERTLYLARKEAESRFTRAAIADAYVASLSARTVVYKGLLTAVDLPRFYTDLRDPRYVTALALFHQRYSTNTFPSWRLAQPLRFLAHNGEINTIQGNRHWMAAREASLVRQWGDDARWLRPICQPGGSDSTSLDNALELLTRSGRSLPHALTLLMPQAWEGNHELDQTTRAMFQAQAPLVEPWDGPAALIFTDGTWVGAALDRNGLRPLRYVTTGDGLVVVASEVGVVALDPSQIVAKGRLGPGQMLVLDTSQGALLADREIKARLARLAPYANWVEHHLVPVTGGDEDWTSAAVPMQETGPNLLEQQALFGYTREDLELVLLPMVREGIEPVWSMGDDTPLSALSQQPRPLSTYFKQRFAQVTNPPIDSLREQLVMSLTTYVGARGDLLANAAPTSKLLHLASIVLDDARLGALLTAAREARMQVAHLTTAYRPDEVIDSDSRGGDALRQALDTLEASAVAVVRSGAEVVVLSDRHRTVGDVPLPMPLALAAVHQALVRSDLRLRAGLVVDTGAVWDVHQMALLIGYGANAVCPHLAVAAVRAHAGTRGLEDVTPAEAVRRYCQSLEKGLLKVMARMGLSTVESYLGAHLFECIGLDRDLVDRYFPGTPAVVGDLSLDHLDRLARDQRADAERLAGMRGAGSGHGSLGRPEEEYEHAPGAVRPRLADRGYVRFRRGAEYHAANPQVVKALQQAAQGGDPEDYRRYAALVYKRPPTAIRDLLTFRPGAAIPLEEVEPASAIVRRFVSTAMSLGALSPEAHLTLTLGVNRLGGRSNTGEGGEDPSWHSGARDGVSMNSRIKQIASARFGVTPAYVVHAEELEIKMAQGSKPGEGGQLPARKVTGLIARLRHTAVGIPLISPPPHHDIYSIEDLAQLILDLKQVNPRATVGVKLVAERGVGTVAAGVAKAQADYILISGHEGGTGASPLSSIKSVGGPWELGLAEAQQVLRLNGLRSRVRVRTDGGLKTGRDIVIAAMLGADEFGFGTAVLVALGCDMARQCHLDTCPTGIATQREDLRQRFAGRPEHVANFLVALAAEVREILAAIGVRSLSEVIGRADLLAPCAAPRDERYGACGPAAPWLDLAPLLAAGADDVPRRHEAARAGVPPTCAEPLAEEQLLDAAAPLLERGHGVLVHASIHNRDRAVGARLAGVIARRWGDAGLPRGTITCQYTGSAGQSFGAFCISGMRLLLVGDANDYVAKGMHGGEVAVMPSPHHRFVAHEQVIVGNTVLYGATGGMLLACGRAGERFAVRNSGAIAVVEGMGDHGCEYMTGGVVVVLGATGRNFAAGMSGGVAYVYDERDDFPARLNAQMVRLERVTVPTEADDVRALIWYHAQATQSDRAAMLLADWPAALARFWRVVPQTGESSARPLETLAANLRHVVRPVA